MDNKNLFAALEAEVQKMKERKPKKEKVVIKPSPPTSQPWDELPGHLKLMFEQIVKSDSEAEARKDKGRPKSGYQIKQDAYSLVQFAVKNLEQSVVITEGNLALAFNHYTTDGLADLLVSGKKHFRLSDRTISDEDIQQTIKDDPSFNGEIHELIKQRKFDDAFTMLEKREYDIAWDLVAEIERDFQETLTGA